MAVSVDPLIVLPLPPKECVDAALEALNTAALFVKSLKKVYVLFAPFPLAGSFHAAPLLSVTGPRKFMARDVVLLELKLIAPAMMASLSTVKLREIFAVPPLLIVSERAE